MQIYKLCFCDDMNQYEVFNHIELFTAKAFQERLYQAICEEQLNEDTLEEYGLDRDTDCSKIPADKIVEIFKSDGYECEDGWLEEGVGE